MLNLLETIEAADKLRSEIVLCLIGQPGIGKTQAVYEFARRHDRQVVEIIASQILPNEVSGITMPVQETHSMEIFDHARLSSLKDGDILFFDELLQAQPATLSACLTLIQERRLMSGKKLPDVLIIAAANPIASAKMIPLSIRQRFMFVECAFDVVSWRNYIKQKFGRRPSDAVMRLINFRDDEYNCMTPRTATKLIQWLIETNCSEACVETIRNMFDSYVSDTLVEWVKDESNVDKIIRNLRDAGFDIGAAATGLISSPEDLLEFLKNSDEWEEIAKVLSSMDMDGNLIEKEE